MFNILSEKDNMYIVHFWRVGSVACEKKIFENRKKKIIDYDKGFSQTSHVLLNIKNSTP